MERKFPGGTSAAAAAAKTREAVSREAMSQVLRRSRSAGASEDRQPSTSYARPGPMLRVHTSGELREIFAEDLVPYETAMLDPGRTLTRLDMLKVSLESVRDRERGELEYLTAWLQRRAVVMDRLIFALRGEILLLGGEVTASSTEGGGDPGAGVETAAIAGPSTLGATSGATETAPPASNAEGDETTRGVDEGEKGGEENVQQMDEA